MKINHFPECDCGAQWTLVRLACMDLNEDSIYTTNSHYNMQTNHDRTSDFEFLVQKVVFEECGGWRKGAKNDHSDEDLSKPSRFVRVMQAVLVDF